MVEKPTAPRATPQAPTMLAASLRRLSAPSYPPSSKNIRPGPLRRERFSWSPVMNFARGPSPSLHRFLVLAAAAFFLATVYLFTSRMLSVSYTHARLDHESLPPRLPQPPPSQPADVLSSPLYRPMSYGPYGRPQFEDLPLVASLPAGTIPSADNGRRLVVVGDIHGMSAALTALLELVNFDEVTDHLVAVGDLVNKGPDSRGVVERLMALNASAVRGNHEDRLLLALAEAESNLSLDADLAAPEAPARRGEDRYLAIARTLSASQIRWLAQRPVILDAAPLPLHVVHAGLVPGVPPAQQDPWAAMNMRTLLYPRLELRRAKEAFPRPSAPSSLATATPREEEEPDRAVAIPVEDHTGERWTSVWDRHQERLPAAERRTVVYGHDARRGVVEANYAFGLDSGCVRGGKLTALVVEGKADGGFKHSLEQVQCAVSPL